MTLISVLIVVALEYYFSWGAEVRSFSWFQLMQDKLEDQFADKSFWQGWGGIAVILLLPLTVLWIFLSVFSGSFYSIILFLTACFILFMTIGPKQLSVSLSTYFEAMERGGRESCRAPLRTGNDLSREDRSSL